MDFGSLPPELVLAVDRACDDFEAAWGAGAAPRIEDYLGRVPDRARPALLAALLATELERRRGRGERPEPREYRDRFPEQAGLIDSLCGAEAAVTRGGEPAAWSLATRADSPPAGDRDGATYRPAQAGPARAPLRVFPAMPGYTIEGELGRGGMGVVYLARQAFLGRPCALKMILVGAHAGPEATVRFLTEAQAAARLQHPHVVQIYHVGEADGLPFLEMEYLEGGSLDGPLRDGIPWPVDDVARLEVAARPRLPTSAWPGGWTRRAV
jgi:hypothetical protein